MTTTFPKSEAFTGSAYRPARFEGQVFDLEIEGKVPDEIHGTFVQVAPDPQYPPMLGDDLFFNGDGAVHAFRFKDGKVDFQRRYVMTDRLKAQRRERESIHGLYRNKFTDDPRAEGISSSTANTNVIFHNGRLLALKEDHAPYALDPITLETQGKYDFDGQLTSATFTAHPKMDPRTGAMLCFGYAAKGDATKDIAYYEIDPAGQVTREIWIEAPSTSMIHDFAVTDNYVIFPLMPITADLDRIKAGGDHWEWQPDMDQYFGIMLRDGDGSDIRWFRAPNGFQGHTVNAFEDGKGNVYFDLPIVSENVFSFVPRASGTAPPPETLKSNIYRWKFDMKDKNSQPQAEPLTDFMSEFPRVDERYSGQEYRHAFLMSMDLSRPYDYERAGPPTFQFMNMLSHLDVSTGKPTHYWADDQTGFQEPIFVRKSGDHPEGVGYVIALANRLVDQSTDLVILDAQHMDEGPLATVHLPVRLRMSLHGNWIPGEDCPTDQSFPENA